MGREPILASRPELDEANPAAEDFSQTAFVGAN
jgi:hypothetical protein